MWYDVHAPAYGHVGLVKAFYLLTTFTMHVSFNAKLAIHKNFNYFYAGIAKLVSLMTSRINDNALRCHTYNTSLRKSLL